MDNEANRLDDIYAAQILQPLLSGGAYLPITSSSMNLRSVAVILNDILINRRTNIIEFGGGITTFLIARMIELNNIPAKLYTVDEDLNWLKVIEETLQNESLDRHVELIHAPLCPTDLALNNINWYDTKQLDSCLSNIQFECVIVDGPSAWRPEIALSRYPALPYMANKLAPNFSLFLDDFNRDGEKQIIENWENRFKIKFTEINNTLAGFFAGQFFNVGL